MRLSTVLLFALSAAPLASAQQGCLSTLFAGNNQGSVGGAVYFDINVLNPNGIKVTDLEINSTADAGTALTVDVYTAAGTASGNETDPTAWTMVASGPGVAAGIDVPTPVDTSDFNLAPGSHGIALVLNGGGNRYTNGDGSNQFYSNADIELTLGSATNVPFTGGVFSPRVANVTVCYNEQSECFLMLGLNQLNFQFAEDTLLVDPLLMVPMTLTNLPVLNVPPSQGLLGTSFYTQALLYNPTAYRGDPLKVSQGLEYRIGVGAYEYGTGSGLGIWPIGSRIVYPGEQIRIGFSIP